MTTAKPKRIRRCANQRSTQPEPTIKRSSAARLIDKTTRTLVRYEALGILHPIKLNCRAVVYRLAEVQKLLSGDVQSTTATSESITPRSELGQFSRAA